MGGGKDFVWRRFAILELKWANRRGDCEENPIQEGKKKEWMLMRMESCGGSRTCGRWCTPLDSRIMWGHNYSSGLGHRKFSQQLIDVFANCHGHSSIKVIIKFTSRHYHPSPHLPQVNNRCSSQLQFNNAAAH